MKRCPDCDVEKPAAAFGRNRSLPDGLSFYCLDCNRRRNSAWYRQSRAASGKSVRDHSWVPEGFRWCPGCRQAIAHEDFSRNARQASGFGSLCLACHRESSNNAYWKRRYGLTRADVATLRAGQGDECAICGAPQPEHLDHDHETGRVRALLCQRCNQGLGLLRDDPVVLRAAADYVERHRESPEPVDSGSTTDDAAHSSRRAPSPSSRPAGRSHGYARWLAMRAAGCRAEVAGEVGLGTGRTSTSADVRGAGPPVGSAGRRPGSSAAARRSRGSSTDRRRTTAGEADG